MMLKIENGCRFRKRIEKGFFKAKVFRLRNDKKHNILYCSQHLVLFLRSVSKLVGGNILRNLSEIPRGSPVKKTRCLPTLLVY